MNIDDLRKKTESELKATLRELAAAREKTAQAILQNKEKNVKKLGVIRKDMARVKTLLAERSREAALSSSDSGKETTK